MSIHTVEAEHPEPAVERLLQLLASDMEGRPAGIQSLSREFAARMAPLAKGKRIEFDGPIDGPVDL